MKQGYLSQYFEAVAAKRLATVEINKAISHQHEFNGAKALKQIFGLTTSDEKVYFPARFIWMAEEGESIIADGTLSWYNARFGKPRAPEYRLYFPTSDVLNMAREGDLLIIAKRTDGSVLTIVAAAGSTMENQLLWLFDVPVQEGKQFSYHDFDKEDDKEVDFAVRFILDELGIDIEEPESDALDTLLEPFARKFPSTREFSLFARKAIPEEVDPLADPDRAIMAWMEYEEKLFRRLERQIVEERLNNGFVSNEGTDIDGFLDFSLSVQNRRKSRAGYALENHLEEIFRAYEITFTRAGKTENKSKPDYIFPGISYYHQQDFPAELLTMLGVKTSLKDRWRQVLAEANKISRKHLLTLEPGISENQTDEMKSFDLNLVIPQSLHETYKASQQSWLMNVSGFIEQVKDKQKKVYLL